MALYEDQAKELFLKHGVPTGPQRVVANPAAAVAAARILGLDIKGHIVRNLLVTPASEIADEYYQHTRRMLAAGTNVVGGVTPGKGGLSVEIGQKELPVYDSVGKAMADTGADTSVIFVPPKFAKDAMIEAIDAEIGLAVVIKVGRTPSETAALARHLLPA